MSIGQTISLPAYTFSIIAANVALTGLASRITRVSQPKHAMVYGIGSHVTSAAISFFADKLLSNDNLVVRGVIGFSAAVLTHYAAKNLVERVYGQDLTYLETIKLSLISAPLTMVTAVSLFPAVAVAHDPSIVGAITEMLFKNEQEQDQQKIEQKQMDYNI